MNKINASFISLLACPATGESLEFRDEQLVSTESNTHYPIINEIPWLLKNPLHSMVDWSVKLNHFQQVLNAEIRDLSNQIKKTSPTTQLRLQKSILGKQEFLKQVTNLVSPILSAKVASKPVYDALSDRAPSTQNLLSYEANLYRDWVWGEEENQTSLKIIESLIGNNSPKNILVLGAGGSRLAYDLHNSFKPENTIANDINPLLLFAAKEIIRGEGLDIYEFPAFPKNLESTAVLHHIKAMEQSSEGFHFLFSDASKPAIQKYSIDTLVTPWLIDIQPVELNNFIRSLNYYLPIGGIWCNFGSLVFNQNRDAYCYSVDEIELILNANGFELEINQQNETPYLRSPYNAGYRVETVYSWRAVKTADVDTVARHENLPEWIIDINKPVNLTREIQQQAFSYQTYTGILQLVDGKRSIQQIAKKVAQTNKIDEKESLSMIKQFFNQLA